MWAELLQEKTRYTYVDKAATVELHEVEKGSCKSRIQVREERSRVGYRLKALVFF